LLEVLQLILGGSFLLCLFLFVPLSTITDNSWLGCCSCRSRFVVGLESVVLFVNAPRAARARTS
jgi:hypothetical protein